MVAVISFSYVVDSGCWLIFLFASYSSSGCLYKNIGHLCEFVYGLAEFYPNFLPWVVIRCPIIVWWCVVCSSEFDRACRRQFPISLFFGIFYQLIYLLFLLICEIVDLFLHFNTEFDFMFDFWASSSNSSL